MPDISTATELTVFGRILLAAALGFAIGAERERRGKSAGERTFALVALGSAAFTAVGVVAFPVSTEKIIAGVATGIGFLGAGVIWRMEGQQARGLTTAATNWTVASLGVICGVGFYITAPLVTVMILVILEADRVPLLKSLLRQGQEEEDPPEISPDT